MEFLDPKKHRAFLIRLIIGYIMIGIALVLTTIILLYQAYGFGLKNGQVIQNGLIFLSSHPNPASIYVNGRLQSSTTDTRLFMQAGQYTVKLERTGYRPWQRAINLEGGTVVHFDYPFLIPDNLVTTAVRSYPTRPLLVTQSPNQRWLLVQDGTDFTAFDLFDLNNPDKAPAELAVPKDIITLNTGTSTWNAVQWANDNQYVLLQHTTTTNGVAASEYILFDTTDPDSSVNLTTKLGVNPTQLVLQNDQYDQYLMYDQQAKTLSTATLSDTQAQPLLNDVLGFNLYGSNMVLYATDQGASPGKTAIKLYTGSQTYTIRQVTEAPTYLLDIAQYNGNWYVVAGSAADNRTYIYKNPQSYLNANPDGPLVPVDILKVTDPDYVSFSANTQFIMESHGQNIAVYDIENDRDYMYTTPEPMDAPQLHPTWMDGDRLMYVSGGKTIIFDYDDTNHQTLDVADPAYTGAFDSNYKALYSLGVLPAKVGEPVNTTISLNSTALLTPQDQ